jgi:putative ABC transport system substrate-binding protein
VHATFLIARRLNPRLARVGAAHNPSEANSRRFMELARASCKALGIELLESAVENSSGVIEAVQATIGRGAEAIFVPGDTTVVSTIESVIATAAKSDVPVFSVNPGVPDRGTLFDVGFNFREVGLVAGRLAADLLSGTDPKTVPIRETTHEIPPYLVLNLATAAAGPDRWQAPDDLKKQARYLIDQAGRHDQLDAVLAGPFDEPTP